MLANKSQFASLLSVIVSLWLHLPKSHIPLWEDHRNETAEEKGAMSSISPYIKHYEGLSYDREDLHRKHLRTRRASHPEEHTLQLDITAFNRTFRLLLKHNAEAFTENVMVFRKNGSTPADLSHLYSGKLE
ncbi:hypothetical protein JOQ06_005713, partial [Pogonophryne albipinna]